MARDEFPPGVAGQLKWYVYRLIDPRNGETFYVGKGQGNRIFHHAKGDLSAIEDEDEVDLKTQRIKAIEAAGLEVSHLVHRHGIHSEDVAYEIEAALIDAYPGLTNQAAGHESSDYGCRHVEEIVRDYSAEPFDVGEPLILICINRAFDEGRDLYDATRYAWRVDPQRAEQRSLVLAHNRGLVVAAYRAEKWVPATTDNFPGHPGLQDRWGFIGKRAEDEVAKKYVGKRVPQEFRGQNPIQYAPRRRTR